MEPEDKLAIILAGEKESTTVKEVCDKHGISRDTYYRWKRELEEAAEQYWDEKSPGRKSKDTFSTKSEAEAAYQKLKHKQAEELLELKKQLEGTTIQRDFYKFRLSLRDAKKNSSSKKKDGS